MVPTACAEELIELPVLEVRLNEVCTTNAVSLKTKDGDTPDWIELYNPSAAEVALDSYWISDDEDYPRKFQLSGRSIPAEGYLVLYADKRDLPFKLSAAGCELFLTREGGETVRLKVPSLTCDQTYSYQENGTYEITDATPNEVNVWGERYEPAVYVAPPVFSDESGRYADSFYLTLSGAEGTTIYYTVDGSVPNTDSTVYTRSIHVTDQTEYHNKYSALTNISQNGVTKPKSLQWKAKVVRAVAVDAAGNRSKVVTQSYFVGLEEVEALKDISILSIVSDPADLFDEEDGIYVLGALYTDWLATLEEQGEDIEAAKAAISIYPANYNRHGRQYEIPASVQWIDENGVTQLNQNLGLRIAGNYSRLLPNKSFRLDARSEYGSGSFAASFWPDNDKIDKLRVRNGGNDQELMFRDVFAHALLEPLGVPVSRAIPCMLFVDGEYWGLYNLREAQDAEYIAAYCNVYEDDVIMIKNKEVAEGYGDERELYAALIYEATSHDLSEAWRYEIVESMMDMDNYVTYMAAQIYIEATDWINISGNNNNVTLWRTRTVGPQPNADGRWRWVFQDLDHTSGWVEAVSTPVQALLYDDLFAALWTNRNFQQAFLTKIMDIANFTCAPKRVNQLMDDYAAYYRKYIPAQYARYLTEGRTEAGFETKVKAIKAFYADRQENVAQQLSDALKLKNTLQTLTISTTNAPTAAVTLNGQAVSFSGKKWSGRYFSACPLTLAAEDMIGYDFAGWYEGDALLTVDKQLTLELTGDRAIRPVYTAKDAAVTLNRENGASFASDGTVTLSTGAYRYEGILTADEGLTLKRNTDNESLTLMPDTEWRTDCGVSLSFDTVGCENLTLDLSVTLAEDAPNRWVIAYSTDGKTFAELDTEQGKLEAGTHVLHAALPKTMSDSYGVTLRIQTGAKGAKDCTGAVTLDALCVAGEAVNASLAEIKQCMQICAAEMGSDFQALDESALANMTEAEINALMKTTYAELTAWRAKKCVRTVTAEDVATAPALEGMTGQLCVEMTAKEGEYAATAAISTEIKQTAYLYRLTEGQLEELGEAVVTDGTVTIPTTVGMYVVSEKPAQGYRYSVSFTTAPADGLLAGANADRNRLWLELTCLTDYQEGICFTLSKDSGMDVGGIYLYTEVGGGYKLAEVLSADETGLFSSDSLGQGRYLVLSESIEAMRYFQESGASSTDTSAVVNDKTANTSRYWTIGYMVAFAVMGACVVALIVLHKREK